MAISKSEEAGPRNWGRALREARIRPPEYFHHRQRAPRRRATRIASSSCRGGRFRKVPPRRRWCHGRIHLRRRRRRIRPPPSAGCVPWSEGRAIGKGDPCRENVDGWYAGDSGERMLRSWNAVRFRGFGVRERKKEERSRVWGGWNWGKDGRRKWDGMRGAPRQECAEQRLRRECGCETARVEREREMDENGWDSGKNRQTEREMSENGWEEGEIRRLENGCGQGCAIMIESPLWSSRIDRSIDRRSAKTSFCDRSMIDRWNRRDRTLIRKN